MNNAFIVSSAWPRKESVNLKICQYFKLQKLKWKRKKKKKMEKNIQELWDNYKMCHKCNENTRGRRKEGRKGGREDGRKGGREGERKKKYLK